MKPAIVQYLRCPRDGTSLTLGKNIIETQGHEILSGELVSANGERYRIERGVPILLLTDELESGQADTAKSFTSKWSRAAGYRLSTTAHYQKWFIERYGFNNLDNLKRFLSTKRLILEAGAGLGRDAEMYSSNSDAQVFALDLSDSIFQVYQDLGHLPNLHLIQADLTQLPFADSFFDFIACDQVIHHTTNTYESFKKLLRCLGDGHIAIYTYKKKTPMREFCDDYIREQTVNMDPDDCWQFSEVMTRLGKALTELKAEITIPEDVPFLELKAGTYDLQRWLYWNFFKCYWNSEIDWNSNVVTNFDWYHPLHAHRHTPEEVQSWCKAERLTIDNFSVVESGISVLAHRR